MIIYADSMLIYVNNIDKKIFKKIVIDVNFMIINVNITNRQKNISKV